MMLSAICFIFAVYMTDVRLLSHGSKLGGGECSCRAARQWAIGW
jgi:hypothetical protein